MSEDIYYRPKRVLGSNETDFAQQFLGEFATMEMPPEDRLALYYHVRCERFDRVVCPMRDISGDARPVTTHETALINQHASEVLRQLAAAHPDLPAGRLRHAISRYGQRYTTEEMEKMLERLES